MSVVFSNASYSVEPAVSVSDKVVGLEAVASLNNNEGMYFPFDDEHVTFHMGKVKYPIDIIFMQKLGNQRYEVTKIVHNAAPGCLESWSAHNVSAVIEINGGQCKENSITIGSVCLIK